MPRRAAVPMTDRTAANRSACQWERKPPVTLRYVAVGRNSRSLALLPGGASGCSRKVNKWLAEFAVMFLQPPAISVGWRQRHDGIEFVIQPLQISSACAFSQSLAIP
jgi:hypothetical protein